MLQHNNPGLSTTTNNNNDDDDDDHGLNLYFYAKESSFGTLIVTYEIIIQVN